MNRSFVLVAVLIVINCLLCIGYIENLQMIYQINDTIYQINNTMNKITNKQKMMEIFYLHDIQNKTEQIKTLVGILEKKEQDNKRLKDRINFIEKEYQNLQNKYSNIKSKKGLINPTYQEIKKFLLWDETDKKEWSKEYDCTEFSNTLIKNLVKKGYFACTTELDIKKNGEVGGHIIVVVNTTDRGLIYIEPQTDAIIMGDKLQIGKNYCSLVGQSCYWEIKKISDCFRIES